MKDNRRKFLTKAVSLSTALTLGSIKSIHAAMPSKRNVEEDLAKDAGMQLCLAYFVGIEPLKIQFARQMGVLGAVGGIDPGMVGAKEAQAWELPVIKAVKDAWEAEGLKLTVVEGPPSLGTKTKLGLPGRDEEIENFITFIRNIAQLGIQTVCYNWMPVINWARTDKARPDRGGALVMGFDVDAIEGAPITEYGTLTQDLMWENLKYFLNAVIPEAEKSGVYLSMHPDDPPVDNIRGIPRIMTSVAAFKRMLDLYPSAFNTLTWDGTFGEMGDEHHPEDLESALKYFTGRKAVSFVHFRNVRGYRNHFHETFVDDGQMDMAKLMKILYQSGFKGPLRPDHVPTMGDDPHGFPGYTTYGTLFAIGYIRGLIDEVRGTTRS